MSDNYTQLYYHFVWATKNRNEFITPAMEELLYDYTGALCRNMGVQILSINGMPNHLHIACTVPPTIAISKFVKDIKGKSSHYINHLGDELLFLAWQPGYGALTFSKRELKTVVGYVKRQKEHHAENRLVASMENCGTVPDAHADAEDEE